MVGKLIVFWVAAGVLAAWSGPAYGEWPEHGLTMVASGRMTLPWSQAPSPQALLLAELAPRLSRELGVPVALLSRPGGEGVLAAETVASARPDGYLFGALDSDLTLTRVIQGYTPYIRKEMAPVAMGWRMVYAVIMSRDAGADDLLGLAGTGARLRLAHAGLTPVHSATLMAIEAAREAGFAWTLEQVDYPDPDLILEGRADAVVLPLGYLKDHPRADRFAVVTVLTHDDSLPCTIGLPTLKSQNLEIPVNPFLAFYVPETVSWRNRTRLSAAINNSLEQPALRRRLADNCFSAYREDMEGVEAVVDQEYENQAGAIRALGLPEAE